MSNDVEKTKRCRKPQIRVDIDILQTSRRYNDVEKRIVELNDNGFTESICERCKMLEEKIKLLEASIMNKAEKKK